MKREKQTGEKSCATRKLHLKSSTSTVVKEGRICQPQLNESYEEVIENQEVVENDVNIDDDYDGWEDGNWCCILSVRIQKRE